MDTITLMQPYATFVALGIKPLETRDRACPEKVIGQRVGVHAGIGRDLMDVCFGGGFALERTFRQVLVAHGLKPETLPFGAVLCTALCAGAYRVARFYQHAQRAEFTEIVPGSDLKPPGSDAAPYVLRTDDYGNYASGRWAYWFRDIERFANPQPARGYQHWWDWKEQGALL